MAQSHHSGGAHCLPRRITGPCSSCALGEERHLSSRPSAGASSACIVACRSSDEHQDPARSDGVEMAVRLQADFATFILQMIKSRASADDRRAEQAEGCRGGTSQEDWRSLNMMLLTRLLRTTLAKLSLTRHLALSLLKLLRRSSWAQPTTFASLPSLSCIHVRCARSPPAFLHYQPRLRSSTTFPSSSRSSSPSRLSRSVDFQHTLQTRSSSGTRSGMLL